MNDNSTLEARVLNLEQRLSALESKLQSSNDSKPLPTRSIKILSEKEYLIEKKPADDVQRTFYLGAYLEEYREVESFTVEDLRSAFRAAREPAPSNINDKINKNIKKGLFMEGKPREDKKTWQLTATGEASIEMEKDK